MANNDMIAGSGIRLRARKLKDTKGKKVLSSDVDTVKVQVFDQHFTTEILTEADMVYDGTLDDWGYLWDSPGPEGALYQVRCRIVLKDGTDFIREKMLMLRTDRGALV